MQLTHGWHVRSKRNWDKRASHTFCVRHVQIQRLHSDQFSHTTCRRGRLGNLDYCHFRVERILRHGPLRRYGSEWPNMRSDNTQQYYRERECNSILQFKSTERVQRHNTGHEWFSITLYKCLIRFRNPTQLCDKLHSASKGRGWFEHYFNNNGESDSRVQRYRGSNRGGALKPELWPNLARKRHGKQHRNHILSPNSRIDLSCDHNRNKQRPRSHLHLPHNSR